MKQLNLNSSMTALTHSEKMSEIVGVPFYIKRDDLCSAAVGYGASAMRKLEFVIVEIAESKASDVVIWCNPKSNYTRLLAYVCKMYGMRLHCIYLSQPEPGDMNVFLSQMYGAIVHGVHDKDYVEHVVQTLVAEGRTVYLAPREGANSTGIMAGVALFDEIKLGLNVSFATDTAIIYVGADTGATMAGMLYGSYVANEVAPHNLTTVGVSTFLDQETQVGLVAENLNTMCRLIAAMPEEERFSKTIVDPAKVNIIMSDISLPRGVISHDLVTISRWFFDNTQVLLDPIYGIHTVTTLIRDVQDGKIKDPVVFVNPSTPVDIFGYKQQFRTVLADEQRQS